MKVYKSSLPPFCPMFLLKWMKKTFACIISRVLKRVSLLQQSSWQPRLLFQKLSICLWMSDTWTRPRMFWSSSLSQPPAVYFRDRQGPWATLSSRCYCLPRWARTPYLSLLLLPFSITSPLHRSLTSLCLCSTGTCGPTEALGYTKKPKLAFICSLLPAVYIVHLCSLSLCAEKYRFYPWHCYYYWLWVTAAPAEMLASHITPCDVLLKFWHVFVSALRPQFGGFEGSLKCKNNSIYNNSSIVSRYSSSLQIWPSHISASLLARQKSPCRPSR